MRALAVAAGWGLALAIVVGSLMRSPPTIDEPATRALRATRGAR